MPSTGQNDPRVRRHSEDRAEDTAEWHKGSNGNGAGENKRRKSSRVHTPVNYSLKSKKTTPQRPQNSQKENGSQATVLLNLDDDLEERVEKSAALNTFRKRVLSRDEELAQLTLKHSLLTQELFHLKEYTSLVTWDPSKPPTKFYNEFMETEYDLWNQPQENEKPKSKRSRHSSRFQRPDSEQARIEELAEEFRERVFDPSKFYKDNFTTRKETPKKRTLPTSQPKPSKPTPAVPQQSAKPAHKNKVRNVEDNSKKRGRPRKTRLLEQEDSDGSPEKDDSSINSSDSEDSPLPFIFRGRIPRVKVKLSAPKPTIANPDNVVNPEFKSIKEYLNSFKLLDEDMSISQYNEYIEEQRNVVSKLRKAVENKTLTITDDFNIQKVAPSLPFRDPLKNVHTHHDHLVAQGLHLSRIMSDSRKQRLQRSRKIANMVESHFKREAGAAERARKEEERRLKTLARNAVQAVKKRWTLAEKAYRILKNQETEELKRIKGKEHLTQMLEHSTQLLEAQMTKQSDEDEDEDEDDSDDDDETEIPSSNGVNTDSFNGIDDANLTVDQLKIKYANLQNIEQSEEEDSSEEDEEEENETKEESHKDQDREPVKIELTKLEKEALEADDKKHDSILDSDTSMGSDSSSESDYSSEEESDTEQTGNGHVSGLASLFGNNHEDTDDDQSVKSYSESEEDESLKGKDGELKEISTPSSTPDSEQKVMKSDTVNDRKSRSASHEPSEGVVDVPTPVQMLRGQLRTYQKQGLNWLASLYNNHTNGILADEMGLGKTIQTISLISYLAVSKGNWGPHLIVVPTSVLLNWEMEFKRFAPGFKVLVYYGSPQQRKEKRKGWNKPDTFHVCITSYQLVCQDQQIFKRKRWKYMILDEAHNIKNFKSNRWNALLNFNTENRLLLTGTPLQNNIMELWSLLYFLMPSSKMNQSMPSGFANLEDFQQWFGKPVDKIIENGDDAQVDDETRKTVSKLHQVLRPYLLRRLKADVESQMPGKYEHIVYCRLSKRQYKLYHEYLARSDTQNLLKNANYISIINCLMQLRKVCNHPDLFEERPITTSFAIESSVPTSYVSTNDLVLKLLKHNEKEAQANLTELNFIFTGHEEENTSYQSQTISRLKSNKELNRKVESLNEYLTSPVGPNYSNISEFYKYSSYQSHKDSLEKLKHTLYLNSLRCDRVPVYGCNVVKQLNVIGPTKLNIDDHEELIKPLQTRILSTKEEIDKFGFVTPAVVTMDLPKLTLSNKISQKFLSNDCTIENPFHNIQTKLSIQFPDKSLLLYDCGKLQKLAKLLQQLKDGGHRALIFTQMTKVLDILEQFLNILGIRYMRLDGATKIEDRQVLTERFNSDSRITVFILSTRSGGLGINLTGADTVIFYDSDWNPAMDKQCQDRCHRIGQTRDVHIYRFVSEYTIESNILKKANQKRHLDNVIIQEGEFTTDYFSKLSVRDLLGGESVNNDDLDDSKPLFGEDTSKLGNVLAQAEDVQDRQAAQAAMKEVALDDEDFNEDKTPGANGEDTTKVDEDEDIYEGTGHIDEYMIRFIANGFYWD